MPLTAEAKTVNREDAFDVSFLIGQVVLSNLIQYFLGALLRSACRKLNHCHKHTLILLWQEGGRQAHKQNRHSDHDYQVDDQVTPGSTHNTADAIGVVIDAVIEFGIKPAKETASFLVMFS